jgi:hypothetical protein
VRYGRARPGERRSSFPESSLAGRPGGLLAGLRDDDAEEARDVFTQEEGVALALEANQLVKNPERVRSIGINAKQAYDGLQRVQRS